MLVAVPASQSQLLAASQSRRGKAGHMTSGEAKSSVEKQKLHFKNILKILNGNAD